MRAQCRYCKQFRYNPHIIRIDGEVDAIHFDGFCYHDRPVMSVVSVQLCCICDHFVPRDEITEYLKRGAGNVQARA